MHIKAYCHENDSFSSSICYVELFWISIKLSTGGSTAIQIISLEEKKNVWVDVLFKLCSFYNICIISTSEKQEHYRTDLLCCPYPTAIGTICLWGCLKQTKPTERKSIACLCSTNYCIWDVLNLKEGSDSSVNAQICGSIWAKLCLDFSAGLNSWVILVLVWLSLVLEALLFSIAEQMPIQCVT